MNNSPVDPEPKDPEPKDQERRRHIMNDIRRGLKDGRYTIYRGQVKVVLPVVKRRVRRNALCPCGSGKKAKRCCIK
jgi:uncharacterized protein YchJ